jgi:hypothetical protein
VAELLRRQGLEIYLGASRAEANAYAGLLLRALGIAPLLSAEESAAMSVARVWADEEARR